MEPQVSNGVYRVPTPARPLRFDVRVPGSKSITNRALLLAALARGESELSGVLFSDDSTHFLGALRELGVTVEVDVGRKVARVVGAGGAFPCRRATIDVGSAGTAARFLTAALAFCPGEYTVNASLQMQQRPMAPLTSALERAGVRFEYLGRPGYLPYKIRALERPPARIEIDASASSQFLSALLLAGGILPAPTEIVPVGEVATWSYVAMTLRMIRDFGGSLEERDGCFVVGGAPYRARAYPIEPDVSSACYFAAAAALTGGEVLLQDVHEESLQGDFAFLRILERMGCTLRKESGGTRVIGPPGGRLQGLVVDMNDCPDQMPTLAALAPFASSTVEIHNVEQVRHHESDRLAAVATELTRLGVRCTELRDGLIIEPGEPRPGTVETYKDHRMAMAFSLVGLRVQGIVIADPDCTAKTFPEYFAVFDQMIAAAGGD